MTSVFAKNVFIEKAKFLSAGLWLAGMLCFTSVFGIAGCVAQSTPASTKVVKRGQALPIFLSPATLAEANQPTRDLLTPYGFQYPGPEKYYGYALRDLRDYLQKTTGAQLPLTAMNANAKSGVFAGTFGEYSGFKPRSESARKAMNSDDPEAFVIEAQGEKLFVLGKTHFGLIAAVYTLLDKVGVKWFAPGEKWENVPRQGDLALGKWNMASSGPSYQSRLFFSGHGLNNGIADPNQREIDVILWMLRNRMGGSAYVQNIHQEEIIPRSLFETRPELFAKITKGFRATQTVNDRFVREIARHKPEVVELAVKNVLEYFKENADKGSTYKTYSLETGDGIPPDEEGEAKFGNATELNFWFANQVAGGLENAGHKDKWVGMLSYSDHAAVPSFDLHPQVAVTLTTGLDTSSNMTVEQRLDGFRARKAQRLGIYPYYNVASFSLNRPGASPLGSAPVVAADLKRWHDHGAYVLMAESTDSWGDAGPGNYIMARFLWDVNSDPEKELDAYYKGAYGSAAPEIRALYEDWGKFYGKIMPKYTRGMMSKWHGLIAAADGKAKDQPLLKARLNDLKRYYLYVNLSREFHLETSPGMPSREERYWKLTRYVASNRGEGAFHARGLTPFLFDWARSLKIPFNEESMGPELVALSTNYNDDAALKALPVYDDKEIDAMFADVALPQGAVSTNPAVLDFDLRLLPAKPKAPEVLRFPKLHGIPGGNPREYIFKVLAPTPKLSFEILADKAAGGGDDERSFSLRGENGDELKQLNFKVNEPVRFDLKDVKPGVFTAIFPGFGAEKVTIRGGSTLGAMRGYDDTLGFNPFRPADLPQGEKYAAFFVVPKGQSSLHVALQSGSVNLGFKDGDIIAEDIKGSEELFKQPREWKFAPADEDRIAYVEWNVEFPTSQGLVIRGVTLFSPDPNYAFYESLNR